MSFDIKICGLRSEETLAAALEAGADLVGLVFFPRSPRHLSLEDGARLARLARGRVPVVALTVDADDLLLDGIAETVRPDLLQLHGRETPSRVAEIRARFGGPVVKALGVADAADLEAAHAYSGAVDRFLLDAKPPKGATRPGGNGLAFDWRLLAGLDLGRPLMLSGGLTAINVAEAVRIARPQGVDASSGVESAPGIKDPARIAAFIAAAREAAAALEENAA